MDNSQLIEKYQMIYQEDPKSRVFAPLSEAYRKVGLLKEALEIAKSGVKHHPNFPSGRVALARALIKKSELDQALIHLEKAVEITPDNILAHRLMAESYLKLKKPKDALRAFKMVLFFNPGHSKAQVAVQKLESLTADEYAPDVFKMMPLVPHYYEPVSSPELVPEDPRQVRESYLSLIDAYIARNEQEKALEVVESARRDGQDHPEIQRRLQIIEKLKSEGVSGEIVEETSLEEVSLDRRRVTSPRFSGPTPTHSLAQPHESHVHTSHAEQSQARPLHVQPPHAQPHAQKNIDELKRLLDQIRERRYSN